MPGIRPTIIVLFSKSHMKQYFGVICGDLPCSELEQLLFFALFWVWKRRSWRKLRDVCVIGNICTRFLQLVQLCSR